MAMIQIRAATPEDVSLIWTYLVKKIDFIAALVLTLVPLQLPGLQISAIREPCSFTNDSVPRLTNKGAIDVF
jgi:hypothetical protein